MAMRMKQSARPLLGTMVVLRPHDVDEATFAAASRAAFARVADIHDAMSFHDAHSDLQSLARARPRDVVAIAKDTAAALHAALGMERASDGAFNACCAPELV